MLTIITATGWPIWPLLFISILGLAILLERAWFLRKKRISPDSNLEQALTLVKQMKAKLQVTSALIDALAKQSPLGLILATGLHAINQGHHQLQCLEAMREVAAPFLKQLSKYLNTLATIATLAPLMGLFGTVLGMIEIFASQGGTSNPTQLAQGISMALYNTAFGLLIAIPALAGWRFLRGMANDRQDELNEATRLLIKAYFADLT